MTRPRVGRQSPLDSRGHQRGFIFCFARGDVGQSLFVLATFRATSKLTRAILVNVLNDEASAAFGTGLRNRFISQRELASRIVRTAVKLSALALLDHYFPGPALGTAHAGSLLLDIFALRIIRASRERSIAALL